MVVWIHINRKEMQHFKKSETQKKASINLKMKIQKDLKYSSVFH